MQKFYTFLAAGLALTALSANADVQTVSNLEAAKANAMQLTTTVAAQSTTAQALQGKAARVAAAMQMDLTDPTTLTDWTSIGTDLDFVDGCWEGLMSGAVPQEKVEVEQSASKPGYYRIVNPFGEGTTYYDGISNIDFADTDHYLYINAVNPDMVWLYPSKTNMTFAPGTANEGILWFTSWVFYYCEVSKGNTWDQFDPTADEYIGGYCGTLKDGIITVGSAAQNMRWTNCDPREGTLGNWANTTGSFRLSLPGAKNYDISLAVNNFSYTPDEDTFWIDYSLGADAYGMVYAFQQGYNDDALAAALPSGTVIYTNDPDVPGVTAFDGSIFPELGENATYGKYTLLAASLAAPDADGMMAFQKKADVEFFYAPDENDKWEPAGTCQLTERMVLSFLNESLAKQWTPELAKHEVALEVNKQDRSIFRMVNPQGETWELYNTLGAGADWWAEANGERNYYAYINIPENDYVSIEPSVWGSGFTDAPQIVIASRAGLYMSNGDLYDDLKASAKAREYFGQFDGTSVITFPTDCMLMELNSPEFIGSWYYAGRYKNSAGQSVSDPVTIESASFNPAGINDVVIDANANAPVEYFNLQGQRVNNPAQGTVVIRRQGDNAAKVLVK